MDDPGEGEPDGAVRLASAFAERRDAAAIGASYLGSAINASFRAWKGQGGDAWRAAMDLQFQRLNSMLVIFSDLHNAFSAYGSVFGDIKERAVRFMAKHESALAELAALDQTISAFSGPPWPELVTTWDHRRVDAEAERDSARRILDELGWERIAAETKLRAAVSAAIPTGWASTRAAALRLGITDPAQMTPRGFATWAERAGADAVLEALQAMDPSQVAAIWGLLPRRTIDSLITAHPDRIGNLEGAAYADRDLANVAQLDDLLAEAELEYQRCLGWAALSPLLGLEALEQATQRRDGLLFLRDRYADGVGLDRRPPEYLISLDASGSGEPLAAISVGNLDTAQNATFFVPGMNSGTSEAAGYLRSITNVQKHVADSAVVLWIGYNSPKLLKDATSSLTDVLGDERAEAGGRRLATALNGFDARNQATGRGARLNLLAHSYGTTTSAYALAGGVRGIDSVTFLGSAGIPKSISLEDFRLPEHSVFVTEAERDRVADTGRMGGYLRDDPEALSWGAEAFGSDGTTLEDGTVLDPVTGHNVVGATAEQDANGYLGKNTESLYNVLKIIAGVSGVTPGRRP